MAVPTVVQYVTAPCTRGGSPGTNIPIHINLPNPTLPGNSLIICGTHGGSAPVWTVTDDKTNTWSKLSFKDTTNNQFALIFYSVAVAAGTTTISLSPNPSTAFCTFSIWEFNNITAFDVASAGANANTGTPAAGSLTPSQTADFLIQVAFDSYGVATTTWTIGSQANITWQWGQADPLDALAVQFGQYNSVSAINPTLTKGTNGWVSIAAAFKTGSTGTARPLPSAGIRVVGIHKVSMPFATAASPQTLNIPTYGDLLVEMWIGGAGSNLTGVIDSHSNTWAQTSANCSNDSNSHIWYAKNPTVSNDMTVSLTRTSPFDENSWIYDIQGSDLSAPFDKDSGCLSGTGPSGTIGTVVTLNMGSLTPSTPNGIVLANMGVNSGTCEGCNGVAGQIFDSQYWDNQGSVAGKYDENNAIMHYYNPNTSLVNITWSVYLYTTGVNQYAGKIAAFKAADFSTLPPGDMTPGSEIVWRIA